MTNKILGTSPDLKPNNKRYGKLAKFKTKKKEKIKIENPVTGKKAEMVLFRDGTPDKKLATVLLDKHATQDKKDRIVADYLWHRGKENASFMAELYLSKGTLTKETRAFTAQMRFDFELFADFFVKLLQSADDVIKSTKKSKIEKLGELFKERADILTKRLAQVTEQRLKEKGYGIYIDMEGKAYGLSEEMVEVAKEDLKKRTNE